MEHARTAGVVTVPVTQAAARLFLGALLTYYTVDGFFAVEAPPLPPDAGIEAMVRLFVRAVTCGT